MSFAAMPSVPMTGMDSFIAGFMLATKQNIELLTGQYGDLRFRSVLTGHVTVIPVTSSLLQLTAKGAGVDVGGVQVPTLADYHELLRSVQLMANDVELLRQTLNTLITQLRA